MSLSAVSKQLGRLTELKPGKHPIVSCYLKLEPRDRSRGKYQIKLKNRARQVLEQLPELGFGRADLEAVSTDLERVQEALRNPGSLPSTQGVAVFASTGLKLFEKIALPWVYKSRLVVDRTPLVRELLAVNDEVGRLMTVVLDRRGARIFEVTAFGATEVADLHGDSTRGSRFRSDRRDAPGAGEHAYHNRIRSEKQRHLSAIADTLFNLDRQRPVHGIVLAGIGADASSLEPFLHPYLRDRVMGTVKLNLKQTTAADVQEATLAARAEFESRAEAAAARELQEALGTGWAVNGVGDTLRALARGQVRTLLVNPDAAMGGYRCGGSGRLVLSAGECRGEGEAVPVPDLIDDVLEEALRQRVAIEVIHSPGTADQVDGLAGLLRFR